MNHLSTVDASFLHLETPETPMHVGSLMLLDLPEGYKGDFYEDVKAMVAERMHLVTLFERKLVSMPFDLADPVWVDDDDVDLDYHVRSVTLRKPGTMAQLEALVARLHSSLLDRSRPLWEIYVIDGLKSGQVAYYTKAHHSGIDGKAGVELVKVLYDLEPTGRKISPARKRVRGGSGKPVGVAELLQAAVSNAARQYLKTAKLVPTAIKGMGTAGRIVFSRRKPRSERSLEIGLAPRSGWNVPITNQRSYSTMTVPLADIKSLGKRVGGTVNTIVMAMCASALRRYFAERNELPGKPLIAAVPVSLRTADDSSMNNQVSMIRVDLATDIGDAHERFKAIHGSSEAAKSVVSELKPVLSADMPFTGSPWLISGLASLVGRTDLVRRMPAAANVCISNVPGLPVRQYLAGARIANFYPVSIPYHGMAVNITVQSYAGQLEFGITACRRTLPQEASHELIGYLSDALKEIESFESVEAAAPAPEKAAPARSKTGTKAAPKLAAPAEPARAVPVKRAARAPVRAAAAARKPTTARAAR